MKSLCVLLVGIFCYSTPGYCQDVLKKPTPAKPINISTVVAWRRLSDVDESYDVQTKLEGLSVDTNYEIELRMLNPFEEPIVFKKAIASCSCSSVKFPSRILPAGESVTVNVSVKTPKSARNGDFSIGFTLYSDEQARKAVGHVSIHANLSGSLEIDNSTGAFEVSANLSSFNIPISFTNPIISERLIVSKSESLDDFVVNIGELEGNYFLEVVAARDFTNDDGVVGRIDLSEPNLGASASAEIIITKKKPVVISPVELRFRSSNSEDSKSQTASVFIQIDQTTLPDSEFVSQEQIGCSLGSELVPIKLKKLSDGIYRASLVLSQAKLAAGNGKISWKINSNGKQSELITTYHFEE